MALGTKSMTVSMKTAWAITKTTGIAISKTSALTLKTVWLFVGKAKKWQINKRQI